MPEQQINASTITRQLQIVFGLTLGVLFLSSIASFYSNRKLINSSQLVVHTHQVIFDAERLISVVKDAETAQRGYIITHNSSFLEPYNGAFEKTMKILEQLRLQTRDNPDQQKNLVQARLLIDQRFAQMRNVLQLNEHKSAEDQYLPSGNSESEMMKGKLLMDDLRVQVERIKQSERDLLVERTRSQEKYIRYTPPLVVAGALIAILISVLAYIRIKADLEERIRKQKEEEKKYEETVMRIGLLEDTTAKIATGDYTARSTDNVKDDLGRIAEALNDMAAALEQNFNELELRNWMQAGAVRLSDAVRGERFLQSVSARVIAGLADYLGAAAGTLYITDQESQLWLSGAYAADLAPETIRSDTSLTGQAMQSQELIVVNDVPANYLDIRSSLGSMAPISLVLLPLVHAGYTVGVVELALLHQPRGHELDFLRNNAEALAISINAAQNYERIQALLEETQAQSEELQAQHAELENINTELELQTEKLQASEEELKVQQEELQQANQELEERARLLEDRNQLIQDRNAEVQRKASELEQSTRYKSEFLANMSHELRTPLNSILLLSRLLKENMDHNLSKDQVEYAEVIYSSGNGLLSLIDEILDLSKIEAGKMQLEYEQVRVAEIIQDISALFEPVAKEKNLTLDLHVAADVPEYMDTDKMRLEQVLRNLLSNALKFTNQGKVSLHVSRSGEGLVRWKVTDTGIGIPEEKQKQIFDAFQQADGSTRRKFGGTGLGLSISKELMKLLQGSLSLESEPGKGSTFTALLPLSRSYTLPAEEILPVEHAEFRQELQEEETIAAANRFLSTDIPESLPDDRNVIKPTDKSILIVEDDIHFARMLIRYTREKGYKAIVAVRGDEGIALAGQFKPAGVLLDIQLPVKSGWEVMEALKADPATRHIPVHVMSSHAVRKESLMKGAINFSDKPVGKEQLQEIFSKLEHVLEHGAKKVLIVEDNPKHSQALAYFLETFRINSEIRHTVTDSVEALKNDVDCVILDMGVPDQHSYDMLEEVKKTPGLEYLPVIIFTGKSLSLSEERRIRQYADSIIVKTAHSYQRILDEVSLFLHLVEEQQPGNDAFKRSGAIKDVLKGKRVLIVDDDVRNIFSLSKILEPLGMQVLTAVDGREAMAQLNAGDSVDVVLLDMMMPEMDGYETARAIRRDARWKSLPVIAVTAKAMTGDREKCINAGASDYITKPVDTDQLISLLRVWLYEHA